MCPSSAQQQASVQPQNRFQQLTHPTWLRPDGRTPLTQKFNFGFRAYFRPKAPVIPGNETRQFGSDRISCAAPAASRGLPVLDGLLIVLRFSLRFQLQKLFVALLRVQQPLRGFRRHLTGCHRLTLPVLILRFLAVRRFGCRFWWLIIFLPGRIRLILVLRLGILLGGLLVLLRAVRFLRLRWIRLRLLVLFLR